jgi:site-specific recombinase XerD
MVRAPSLGRLVDGYLITLRSEGKSPHSVAYYQRLLNNFLWWCDEQCIPKDVEVITAAHIRNFLLYIRMEPVRWGGRSTSSRRPASSRTVAHYHGALRTFYNWLINEGLASGSPLETVKPPKVQEKVIQPLTPDDIRRLLDQCDGKTALGSRNRAIILLFFDTGMRLSELANLIVPDIDFERGAILIREGKGQKQRIVHMGSYCQKAVWRWVTIFRESSTNSLFVNREGQPLQARAVQSLIKRSCTRASVAGNGGCHRLRHTFSIEFLRAGGDLMSLQYLLGHSSLEMVKRYLASLNADDAARAHQRFSSADNMKLHKPTKTIKPSLDTE